MTEMIRYPANLPENADQGEQLARMADAMSAMAGMLKAALENIEQLRRQVRLLEKVTPAQAGAVNAEIRRRAGELCGLYGAGGGDKAAAAAIRKAMRAQFGIQTARDLPRCDWTVAMDWIRAWEDYGEMMRIKRGARHA